MPDDAAGLDGALQALTAQRFHYILSTPASEDARAHELLIHCRQATSSDDGDDEWDDTSTEVYSFPLDAWRERASLTDLVKFSKALQVPQVQRVRFQNVVALASGVPSKCISP